MSRHVYIEATDAFNPQRRGIGVQMRSWIESAPFNEFPDYEFIICGHKQKDIEQLHLKGFHNVRVLHIEALTLDAYIDELYSLAPSLIFFPNVLRSFVRNSAVKMVGIDYGMEDFYARHYLPERNIGDYIQEHAFAMQTFDGIVTVSQTSKRDLQWFFPEFKDKVDVVYPGIVQSPPTVAVAIPKELQSGQYFLVTGYEHKKNSTRIAQAFDAFKQETKSAAKLVFIGRPGFGAEEIDASIAKLSCRKDIVRLGYVSEPEKQALLSRCHAVVALPIYEGFGISALEGMQAGKLVLVSDNGSLKEVIKDAGYAADPFSVPSMARQFANIDSLKDNPKLKFAIERLAEFNQEVQSRKLLKYLTKLA